MWPHRRQPTRLPRPWDSPGKNTGVGCCFLLQCMKVKSQSEVAQSCPTLSDPMDCSPPGSSIHGIFQARVPEWGAIAFSEHYRWETFILILFLLLKFWIVSHCQKEKLLRCFNLAFTVTQSFFPCHSAPCFYTPITLTFLILLNPPSLYAFTGIVPRPLLHSVSLRVWLSYNEKVNNSKSQ